MRQNEQGHNEMSFPFRQRPHLPDNRRCAVKVSDGTTLYLKCFANLEKMNIARCYVPGDFGEVIETELHHFSYLRVKNKGGEIHCSLVIGKARVSPTKLMTIPRREFTVAVVSVTVSHMLREELGCANAKEYFLTDSKVVLSYINNHARGFHTFVANRVQKIRNSTTPQKWHYGPTDKNPADGALVLWTHVPVGK